MPYSVLIVDDQKSVSRLLRSALEMIGHGLLITETPSGEEAILEAGSTHIDLLIADYRLPGINGVELIEKFRARNPNGKVIMISGVTDPWLLKHAAGSGADAFFSKPVPMGDFLDAVESCLGLPRTNLHKTEMRESAALETEGRKGLSDLLVTLRKDLISSAVMLIDSMGRIVAETGQLPDPNSTVQMLSSLMGMSNVAQKVASLIDPAEHHLHLFHGSKLDGIFLPVGPEHALLLIGENLMDTGSLASRLDLLFTARIELLEVLKKIGNTVEAGLVSSNQPPAIDETPPPSEELPGEFMSMFSQIGKKTDEVDSFWETAVEGGTTFAETDKLTYEQASRLGLTQDRAQAE